jgi:hypothetical protein
MGVAAVPSANLVPKRRTRRQPPKNLSAMYCARHEQPGTYGWEVRVPGHPSEFFADSKYGGKAAAFRQARQRVAELADHSMVNVKTGRFGLEFSVTACRARV